MYMVKNELWIVWGGIVWKIGGGGIKYDLLKEKVTSSIIKILYVCSYISMYTNNFLVCPNLFDWLKVMTYLTLD